MYRRIVSLCLLVLLSGGFACMQSDHDDDYDHEDSSVTGGDDAGPDDTGPDDTGPDDTGDMDVDDSEIAEEDNPTAEYDGVEPDVGHDPDADPDTDPDEVEDPGEINIAALRLIFFDLESEDIYATLDLDLEDETIYPDLLRGLPLADDSKHHYLFHSTALLLGAYDLTVQAIDQTGEVIEACTMPVEQGISGLIDDWIQVFLLIQCDQEVGITQPQQDYRQAQSALWSDYPPDFELELILAINYAPIIETVEVHPSTTVKCPATVELCATVVEPDHDPVAFQWRQLEGLEPLTGPDEVRRDEDQGITEYCVEYQLPRKAAHYEFELQVFDQLIDDGGLISIESWYRQQGYGEFESRDATNVSFDVYCPSDKKYPE